MRLSFVLPLAAVLASAQNLPNPLYDLKPLIGMADRGEGQPATETLLDGAYGVAEDANGNIFISESNAGVIRKVRPDGVVERFAGTGVLGNTSAGRPALETDLTHPTVLLIDKDGGLLFYESQYCRIRKVQTDGTVADIAGLGRCSTSTPGSFSGTRERRALDTDISGVGGMALDSQGRLLYSEPARNIVRRIDTDGFIRTMAGTGAAGFSGDSAAATAATLYAPQGLASDGGGNLYIGDGSNCRIRKVDTSGIITTVLGTTSCASSASSFTGGAKTALSQVGPIAYDAAANALYVGMPRAYKVARFDLTGLKTTPFLGNGKIGADEPTTPLGFALNDPSGILASTRLGILVAGDTSFQVYRVQNGTVARFAGSWPRAGSAVPSASLPLLRPAGLLLAADQSLLFLDAGAGFLQHWTSAGQVSAVAGMSYPSGYSSGERVPALQGTLVTPSRVVRDSSGATYVSTVYNIRLIDTQGVLQTYRSNLSSPTGMVLDSQGRLVYSETGKHQVVRYDPSANTTTVIAGTGVAGMSGEGEDATTAKLNSPGDLVFDASGNLLIADSGNHRIRRLNTDGTITTIAGNGLPLAYCDITGLLATKTGLGTIEAMTIDADGNIYLSEGVRVDKITQDGKIQILTGFLAEDDDGNRSYIDGPLNDVNGLAVDPSGRLYISVRQGGSVLLATPKN